MRAKIMVGKLHVHHTTRKDKSGKSVVYDDYYFGVGTETVKKFGLKADEYYVIAIMPAQWYDLLDLEKDGYVYKHLPEDVRKHVDWLRRAEEEGVEIAEG